MFDKKIDDVINKMGDKLEAAKDDAVAQAIKEAHDMTYLYIEPMMKKLKQMEREVDELSNKMKIVIGISLGLSLADTILLFAILKKMK